MSNKTVYISVPLAALAFITASAFVFFSRSSGDIGLQSRGVHRPLFWEESMFYDAVLNAASAQPLDGIVRGGIIPHHLLASDIIAEFFQRLSIQQIKRIVLIGPNHNELGRSDIISSFYDWDTPVGVVRTDIDFINTLQKKRRYVAVDEVVAENEHSVAGIMPFIAHYFPSAKVVPIIISTKLEPSQLDDFAGLLGQLGGDETLFVAAVDFSHYLTSREAEQRDATTLALLRSGNLDSFLTLNNEYTDSPKSVALLFKIMRDFSLTKFDVLRNENSGGKANSKFSEVTSYFSVVFKEEWALPGHNL